MEFKDSKTALNLMKSFAGECQARMRYEFYAEEAREEGYQQIADIFEETARNEMEHAERFFGFLTEEISDMMPLNAEYPVHLEKEGTLSNLLSAAAGENDEATNLYPSFAETAQEEGYPKIAAVWRAIASVESHHEARYKKLASNVEGGTVFKKDGEVYWKCNKCGYITKASEAPKKCPSCGHSQEWFELLCENY